ncbi:MAG TPA: DUF4350 domain-containing protein [Mycobacteriales bacterium]|nr:DUF4350 domain-containing protein [Mycobacteriales bacterium]
MTTTSSRPVTTARAAGRRARVPVAVGLSIVAAGILLALLGTAPGASLDPTSPSKGGAAAVAQLLSDRGVTVQRVEVLPTTADGSTVVVPDVGRLTDTDLDALARLARTADVVVGVDPDATPLSLDDVQVKKRDPACTLPAAVTAGDAEMGGATFGDDAARDNSDGSGPDLSGFAVGAECYPAGSDSAPTLLVLRGPGGGTLTLLGSATFLRNDHLAHDGNAALALGLLDAHPTVTWVLPTPGHGLGGQGETEPLHRLLPRGVLWAFGELAVVVLMLALWRGRRLGPVLREPLPVVVRAAETVRGRARLYRAAHARDRAAQALRQATRARVARSLGLPATTTPPALTAAVADHSGRPTAAVAALLYGDDRIPDDAGLVRLTDDLDQLEREVRL